VSGTSGNQLFPYAKYLEQALHQQTNGVRVSIHQVGLPTWTTTGMLKGLDGTKAGLRANIKKHSDPDGTLSLVILLAGTNDVLLKKPPTAQVLEQNLQKLHQVCLDAGVPRTLAISIPAAIVFTAKQAALVTTVNAQLQQHFATSAFTTFVPFPLDTTTSSSTGSDAEPHQAYWHSNGKHLTESGYQRLGESLAPIVQQILQELDRPAADAQDGPDGDGDDGKQDEESDDGEGNEEDKDTESDP
jgi:lysophospholipase L1-like esterase